MKDRKETITECVVDLSHKDLHDLNNALSRIKVSAFKTDGEALVVYRVLQALGMQIALEQGCDDEETSG